jgi:hypothetical protein
MHKVDVVTYSMVGRIEGRMRVTACEDGACDAMLCVGRGIEWHVKWRTGQAIPMAAGMTHKQREELCASASHALQRLNDKPVGGFTPRESPSEPGTATFA